MPQGTGKRLLVPHFSVMVHHPCTCTPRRRKAIGSPTPCFYYLDTSLQAPRPPNQDPYTRLLKPPAQVLLCQLRSAPSLPACLTPHRLPASKDVILILSSRPRGPNPSAQPWTHTLSLSPVSNTCSGSTKSWALLTIQAAPRSACPPEVSGLLSNFPASHLSEHSPVATDFCLVPSPPRSLWVQGHHCIGYWDCRAFSECTQFHLWVFAVEEATGQMKGRPGLNWTHRVTNRYFTEA